MTTALLYFAVAAITLALCHRLVAPLSRRAAVVLLLLPLVFTGKALLTGRVYAPIDLPLLAEPLASQSAETGVTKPYNSLLSDVYSLYIPWRAAVRHAYSHGELPLWNPFNFAGDILAGSAQPTPYEPYFVSSLLLPIANSFTYLAAITLFLAALLMFVFLRDLRCSEVASLTGAAAWAFCSYIVFWLEWVLTPSTMWFPLVLTGVRRCIRDRSLAAMALLTFAFVMLLLNGHPETALHATLLGLIWAAGEMALIRGRHFVRIALLGLGAGVLALLLTAIYMMPVIEAIPQTYEHFYRERVFAKEKKSISASETLQRLSFQVVPFRFGDPSSAFPQPPPAGFPENVYAGTVILPFAIIGLWRARERMKWTALIVGLFGLVIGVAMPPFADWLAAFPLFDIALNTRLIFAASFGLIVLAALGVDVVLSEDRDRLLIAVSVATFALLAIACALHWRGMQAWGLPADFMRSRTASMLVPLLLLAVVAATRRAPLLAASVLMLVVAQRGYEAADFYPTLDTRLFYPRFALLDRLPQGDEPYRIVGHGLQFFPNMSAVYGVEDIRGYQAMTYLPLRTTYPIWCSSQVIWWNRVDDLTKPFLSMMNVRFAFMSARDMVPNGWRVVAEERGNRLVENERVLPRAFVPRSVHINTRWESLGAEMTAQQDFAEGSWLEVPGGSTMVTGNGPATVTIRKDGMRAFKLHTSATQPTWVVVTQTAWKGWRVFIDGKSDKLRRANHAFLAFYAPAGEHEVRLEYLPQSFVAGRLISVVTAAALLLLALRYGRT